MGWCARACSDHHWRADPARTSSIAHARFSHRQRSVMSDASKSAGRSQSVSVPSQRGQQTGSASPAARRISLRSSHSRTSCRQRSMNSWCGLPCHGMNSPSGSRKLQRGRRHRRWGAGSCRGAMRGLDARTRVGKSSCRHRPRHRPLRAWSASGAPLRRGSARSHPSGTAGRASRATSSGGPVEQGWRAAAVATVTLRDVIATICARVRVLKHRNAPTARARAVDGRRTARPLT